MEISEKVGGFSEGFTKRGIIPTSIRIEYNFAAVPRLALDPSLAIRSQAIN